jgi:hypothetical protein
MSYEPEPLYKIVKFNLIDIVLAVVLGIIVGGLFLAVVSAESRHNEVQGSSPVLDTATSSIQGSSHVLQGNTEDLGTLQPSSSAAALEAPGVTLQ